MLQSHHKKLLLGEVLSDDDDDELFCWYGWPTKGIYYRPYFQPGPLSEILTIVNLRHVVSRIWTCAEPEFKLCRMKLCNSVNHFTTAPVSSVTQFTDIGITKNWIRHKCILYLELVIQQYSPWNIICFLFCFMPLCYERNHWPLISSYCWVSPPKNKKLLLKVLLAFHMK